MLPRPSWLPTVLAAATSLALVAGCSPSDGGTTPSTKREPAAEATTAPAESAAPVETQEPAAKALPFTVLESAFVSPGTGAESFVHWVALLGNPNDAFYGVLPKLTVTARDASGQVLATEQQVLNALPPATNIAWEGQLRIEGEIASLDVEMLAITALYRDGAGVLIGGASGFVSALPANGSIPFSLMDSGQVDNPPVIEIYAVPWSGAPDVWNELAVGR